MVNQFTLLLVTPDFHQNKPSQLLAPLTIYPWILPMISRQSIWYNLACDEPACKKSISIFASP